MEEIGIRPSDYSVTQLGINKGKAYWNFFPDELMSISLAAGQTTLASNGAMAVNTGEFTGRSPKDKFIVSDAITKDSVWWSNFNIPFDAVQFDQLFKKMIRYFEHKEFYIRDAFACADPGYRLNLRVINEYAWSNLFAYNMFLRPSADKLVTFQPDWLILNAPGFHADPKTDGTRSHNFSIIDFTRKIILIGGSGYTGEIKKSVFTVLNFTLPKFKNVLPMHCSANIGKEGDTAIFFGLSGTGKTTLSADPHRKLIGDDEHGWTADHVIFNFEGGCYAKTIGLDAEKEPDIFHAIRKGALLENIVFKSSTNDVDYNNSAITENTRVSYPIEHIKNIATPHLGCNPKNIFFLTCDACGILPPIARLTPEQAAFHFISGYTAKVAGTEAGITEPSVTFSACFGAPFMPLHPVVYADLLQKRIREANVSVWLINTGWSGGAFGTGKRISLKYTRALISAALNGSLLNVPSKKDAVFGLAMPLSCEGVPSEILDPGQTWSDRDLYDQKAHELANLFLENLRKFGDFITREIKSGGPVHAL